MKKAIGNGMSELPGKEHVGNNLDLLRLFFAASVLLSHSPELLDGNRSRELLSLFTGGAESFGEFGVNGFFALSGYLIMSSWCRNPVLRIFIRNRILRIYPGFLVAFAVSVLIIGPLASHDGAAYFHQLGILRLLFSWITLHQPWYANSFPGLPYPNVNAALWTISYEFVCYFSVATIALMSRNSLKNVWISLTLLLVICACFVPEFHKLAPINRFNIGELVRFAAIFFVGASYFLLGFKGVSPIRYVLYAGMTFLILSFSHRFQTFGFALFGTYVLLYIGLKSPKMAFAGKLPDISYGTYLYGWPIINLIIWTKIGSQPWSVFLLSLIGSLGCGYVSWRFVEAPCMRLKEKRRFADQRQRPAERQSA